MLLWLADVLRGAGLTVHETPGWRTREVAGTDYGPVRGVICHETRGSATSTDAGEIGVLINGRVGLSGPIAQLYLSRDGDWHVIAAGTCHHVKTGWGGPHAGYGNDSLLGIEAQHAESESWANKPAQYRSYVRGVAAILRHTGWPVSRVAGHKEHQPGDKPDPEFNMDTFRADVAAALVGEDDDMTPQELLETKVASTATGVTASVGDLLKQGLEIKMLHLPAVQRDMAELRYAVAGLTQALAAVLESGGSVDTAAVLARIDQRATEDAARDAEHGQALASLAARAERAEAEAAALRQRLATALAGS